MLTSLVYLQQGNVKNSQKMMELANLDEVFISSEHLRNFNEIFRKVTKKEGSGIYILSRKYSFGKTKGEGGRE